MNPKCSLKLQKVQNELRARINRHPQRRCRKVAYLCSQQSREATPDQHTLALCRLKSYSSLSSVIEGARMRKKAVH